MNLVVNPGGQRIDKYLSTETEYSRSTIQKMLNEGYILVNEQKVKANYMTKSNDQISIQEDYRTKTDLVPENIALDIVYEDADLMIINKPSGMVVHPGNGNSSGTLVNALINHTNNLSNTNDEIRPGIVHRIDKDTSGLMIVAKNNKTHELLAAGFKNKTIKREYIALLIGELKTDTALIDAPIGRDPIKRKQMAVTDKNAKQAITHLTVIKRYQGFTLVKLNLETGRTHQIRAHMKYIGFPIYNDPVYTNRTCTDFGQFLHSAKIDFHHPTTKKNLAFEQNLPDEFNNFLKNLTILS